MGQSVLLGTSRRDSDHEQILYGGWFSKLSNDNETRDRAGTGIETELRVKFRTTRELPNVIHKSSLSAHHTGHRKLAFSMARDFEMTALASSNICYEDNAMKIIVSCIIGVPNCNCNSKLISECEEGLLRRSGV